MKISVYIQMQIMAKTFDNNQIEGVKSNNKRAKSFKLLEVGMDP